MKFESERITIIGVRIQSLRRTQLTTKQIIRPTTGVDSGVSCLTDGWQGSVVIRADMNIAAIGRPHFGSEVYSYNGFTGGGLMGYMPMLFSYGFGGSYNASLYLQNIDPTDTAGLTIKFYDTAGNLTCTINDSLAPLATFDYCVPDTLPGCSP